MPADDDFRPRLAPIGPRRGVAPEPSAQPIDLTRLSLLVLEDDEGDALYLSVCLEELRVDRVRVRWCRTLGEAHRLLEERPVDCVLTDLGLPDAAGMQAVHDLVAAAGDAAVIVLTGMNDQPGGEQALAAGAQDYLVKDGLSGDLLGRCVRYALERKKVERTSRQLEEASLRAGENARLERGLLPRPLLTGGSVTSAAHYRPGAGNAVLGGDFYDIVERADGSVRAVIGDVMGHGTDEAAIGVHLRVAWRALVLAGIEDDQVLPSLQVFCEAEALPVGMFVTACDITVSPALDSVTVRTAGHPAPILAGADGARYLPARPVPPLGLIGVTDRTWPATVEPLTGRWQLMLFTDGLLDAFRDHGDDTDIGIDHLVAAAAATSDRDSQRWLDGLTARAASSVTDDLAIVVLARSAQ